jgi:diguanylate cyclase (GGDEF)-like protein/PAS domain S-box-containing protein
MHSREQRFREMTEALPVGVLHFDRDGHVLFSNPRLHEILGLNVLHALDEVRELVAGVRREDFDAAVEGVLGGDARDLELQLDLRDIDRTRFCQMNLRPLGDGRGAVTGAVACLFDVTDSVRLRDELQERANFDDLTGCHNRASTLRHLGRFLSNGNVGVLFIDLDEFKPVNDNYGHNVGDELLALAADRLRTNVRREDVVGRIGGDEFVVLYPGLTHLEQLSDLLVRLDGVFQGPVDISGTRLRLQASFGAAFGQHGANPDEVLAEADAAMYSVKRHDEAKGRSPVVVAN